MVTCQTYDIRQALALARHALANAVLALHTLAAFGTQEVARALCCSTGKTGVVTVAFSHKPAYCRFSLLRVTHSCSCAEKRLRNSHSCRCHSSRLPCCTGISCTLQSLCHTRPYLTYLCCCCTGMAGSALQVERGCHKILGHSPHIEHLNQGEKPIMKLE